MVTIYFETEVVAASVRFDADDFYIGTDGRLNITKGNQDIAVFEAGIWKYVDQTEYEVPIEEKEKRTLPRNRAAQSNEPIG